MGLKAAPRLALRRTHPPTPLCSNSLPRQEATGGKVAPSDIRIGFQTFLLFSSWDETRGTRGAHIASPAPLRMVLV